MSVLKILLEIVFFKMLTYKFLCFFTLNNLLVILI